jgi:uncharacterized protein (TIGR02444 family)
MQVSLARAAADFAISRAMPAAGDSFWEFSLAFYALPEVAAACLALQDRHGCDVNLLLYACWVGLSGRGRLGADDLACAAAAVAPWRESVVDKLRAARRALGEEKERSGPLADLYDAAKAVELAAERIAQQRLAALAPVGTPAVPAARAADAAANLALYLGATASSELTAPILTAIAAAGIA